MRDGIAVVPSVPDDRLTPHATTLVGVCAAALNFSSLAGLAVAASYPHWLSWCYPVCVDAYGLVAARVWLRGVHSDRVQRWAKGSSLFVLAVSMGAAGLHAFAGGSGGGLLPIWAAFLVSMLPALMLGLAVHLLVLVRVDGTSPAVEAAPTPVHEPEPGDARETVAAVAAVAMPARRTSKRQAARVFYDQEIGPGDGRGPTELGALFARRFAVHEATGRQWVTAFRREDAQPRAVNGHRFEAVS